MQTRQARLLDMSTTIRRRFAEPPGFAAVASGAVLGSRDNELAPGIALHAEFLALAAAGLPPERILRAAGVNAAAALRVDLQLGRIAVGAAADLLFVDGDPLADVARRHPYRRCGPQRTLFQRTRIDRSGRNRSNCRII